MIDDESIIRLLDKHDQSVMKLLEQSIDVYQLYRESGDTCAVARARVISIVRSYFKEKCHYDR